MTKGHGFVAGCLLHLLASADALSLELDWKRLENTIAVDPACTNRLIIESAFMDAGAGLKETLTSVRDFESGSLLVGGRYEGICSFSGSILGFHVAGGYLKIQKSRATAKGAEESANLRAILADQYARDRNRVGGEPCDVMIQLDVVFGWDALVPHLDSRPWVAIALPQAVSTTGRSLMLNFATVKNGQASLELDERLRPIGATLDGKKILILDRGIRTPGAVKTEVSWSPFQQISVKAGGTKRAVFFRGGGYTKAGDPDPTSMRAFMVVDPESRAVMVCWDKWGNNWDSDHLALGARLVAFGHSAPKGEIYAFTSEFVLAESGPVVDSLEDIEKKVNAKILAGKGPQGWRIRVGDLLGPNRFDSSDAAHLAVVSREGTSQGTMLIKFAIHHGRLRKATGMVELDASFKLIRASYNGIDLQSLDGRVDFLQ